MVRFYCFAQFLVDYLPSLIVPSFVLFLCLFHAFAYYVINYLGLDIGMMVRMFANGSGDLGSKPGRVIPKTEKMVLDASLLYTQHYKVTYQG